MPKLLRVLIVLIVIGVGSVGVWFWKNSQPISDENLLIVFGNIDVRQVELAINGSERIAELAVEEGDRVKSGQLLAKLQTERFEYSVERAKAMVDTQRQVLARLDAGSRPEEITKARADVTAAQATVRDAEATFKRNSKLVTDNAVSQQEVDDSKEALRSAQARETALQAILDLAIAGPRKEDIAEAKATLKRYEAELALAEHDLEDASLYSPANAIVQARILEVGDMASPQKPVFTVALTDPVWVRAYVSEPDLGKITEGMKAAIVTDSFPDKEYEGWIGFISPSAEFTPKPVETRELRTKLVYQIRVFAENPRDELRLGMPATVKIRLKQIPKSDQTTEDPTGRSEQDASAKPVK